MNTRLEGARDASLSFILFLCSGSAPAKALADRAPFGREIRDLCEKGGKGGGGLAGQNATIP